MFTVYVLKSVNWGKQYVGFTENIDRRLNEHNSGKSKFTSIYKPWELLYSEPAKDRLQARKREKYLKSAAGRRFIKKHLQINKPSEK